MNLQLKGITKRFGGLVANDQIDLHIAPGKIHALLGENGAGKTTLMNVLYGLMQPDEGTIEVDGEPAVFRSPKDAISAGIGMVHQHFMLVPVFTVAENVTLGVEETRTLGLLDRRRMRRKVSELSERYGLRVDPDAMTEDLPVGVQQRVEILKALLREAKVLILDEPTAVLTPGETADLMRVMRELREAGQSIVFISHKLKEVQAIADTITILRRGKVVGERPPGTSEEELASLMVGRPVQLQVTKKVAQPGEVVLDVSGLSIAREHTGPTAVYTSDTRVMAHAAAAGTETPAPGHAELAVNDVSFQVRAGEILGIAGVQGNGQTELCEALMGLRPILAGSVHLGERDLTRATPRDRLRAGIGYIPEDRLEDGLITAFSVAENLILDVYDRPPFASRFAMNLGTIRETATARVAEFDVRTTSISEAVGTLSGGNQQKVIVAREVGRDVKLLLASQPTRGLDVGSIEFVHRRMIEQRDSGIAVLIVSSELDEIYALADRIAVMYEGKITGFRPPTVPVEELGLLMAGVGDEEAASAAAAGKAARPGGTAAGPAAQPGTPATPDGGPAAGAGTIPAAEPVSPPGEEPDAGGDATITIRKPT